MEILIIGLLIVLIVIVAISLSKFANINSQLADLRTELAKSKDNTSKLLSDEISRSRSENERINSNLRSEITQQLKIFGDNISGGMKEVSQLLKDQLSIFARELNHLASNFDTRLETLTTKIENNLRHLQEDNSKKLEEMRLTVDEKLHATLEKRLSDSFSLVSTRLEEVHKGLGEMQSLAIGVGDLKKVLSNVKLKGVWGEMQLKSIIDQILTPEQYEENVAVKKGSRDVVEFAIKLPGRNDIREDIVYLPIDAKFPLTDFENLIAYQELGDLVKIEESRKSLENRIKSEAKSISQKYIDPPATTDFAIMFLPLESLYAEVLRIRGLADIIQREYRVVISGPSNLMALLNSLQMGFRTVAIQKRSSEVWRLLGAVKAEFVKFGDVLEKTQQKLDSASKEIGEASKRSRAIERRLQTVQEVPANETANLIEDKENF